MNNWLNLFRLLSDETRLKMMVVLFVRPLCVCELSSLLKINQPKISKHLSKLKDLGYVDGARHEKYILYTLNFKSAKEAALFEAFIKQVEEDVRFLDLLTRVRKLPPIWDDSNQINIRCESV